MRIIPDEHGLPLNAPTPSPRKAPQTGKDIEAQVAAFEKAEREKMGLVETAVEHWFDANPQTFTKSQREHTTLLFGGLTEAQDFLIGGALQGLGYKVHPLGTPDNEALRLGKEFGNRGQCNPTYFTVGNLVKYLTALHVEKGLAKEEIVRNYIFVTAGACGPCRFGMYATEYRKALRDAGFDGFRVMLFKSNGGLSQVTGEEAGLKLDRKFFLGIIKALLIGDILNVAGYRIRPYEVVAGATDKAIAECKAIIRDSLARQRSVLLALRKCRRILDSVEVDRLNPKPKVSVIGEFWAMTTEGDGNYRLQRFLEAEGAEVESQMVTAWLFYQTWQLRWDARRRMNLREADFVSRGLGRADVRKRLLLLNIADFALKSTFSVFTRALGLKNVTIPNMDEIATVANPYYDNHLRGGEGHMEVGKLIQAAKKRKAHMVVSVKPFGCMPSSSVSDGVQSMISERYPEAIFCAIETTGDAAVNMQSRVQMQLFKAKAIAQQEFDRELAATGLTLRQARQQLARRKRHLATFYSITEGIAGTGAKLLNSLVRRRATQA